MRRKTDPKANLPVNTSLQAIPAESRAECWGVRVLLPLPGRLCWKTQAVPGHVAADGGVRCAQVALVARSVV